MHAFLPLLPLPPLKPSAPVVQRQQVVLDVVLGRGGVEHAHAVALALRGRQRALRARLRHLAQDVPGAGGLG